MIPSAQAVFLPASDGGNARKRKVWKIAGERSVNRSDVRFLAGVAAKAAQFYLRHRAIHQTRRSA
jgi:hypothetical protein